MLVRNELLLSDRKTLGAYYTPGYMAGILSRWAIRSRTEHILEPSFGGCGFLHAAYAQLMAAGCESPLEQIYGCDIDQRAFRYLHEEFEKCPMEKQFILSDFIRLSPNDFARPTFDVIVGNPPYISYHNMSPDQKASISAWRRSLSFSMSARASLWAYFVLHALRFLESHGRMAWILPSSLLHSEYAGQLVEHLTSAFHSVQIVRLGERIFLTEGTDERTVLLLCDGFGEVNAVKSYHYCSELSDLEHFVDSATGVIDASIGNQHIDASPSAIHADIGDRTRAINIGEFGKIIIGTVTGANNYFILSYSQAQSLGLTERYLKPIFSKMSHANGIVLTPNDICSWSTRNCRSLMFHVPDHRLSRAAREYIESYPAHERATNSTFSRRSNWLAADDGRIPDAFLSYMTHDGPRLVLNNAGINSTNSIHRVFFKGKIDETFRKLIAISLFSTYSQLSAELEGRSYGSGVLKLEPNEAKRLLILVPEKIDRKAITVAFEEIDRCMRMNNTARCAEIADSLFFNERKGDHKQLLENLNAALKNARSRRKRST